MKRDPIHLTFNAVLRAEREDQRAAFVAARKQAEDDLWAQWRVQRAAREDRDRLWRDLP